uniref:Uncharacterized protein n=1 Tax=Knipowitschia caucasica TaxID=637954 RepID=A0AAV2J2W1_KNICA
MSNVYEQKPKPMTVKTAPGAELEPVPSHDLRSRPALLPLFPQPHYHTDVGLKRACSLTMGALGQSRSGVRAEGWGAWGGGGGGGGGGPWTLQHHTASHHLLPL